jgi:hypothetical protein
MILESGLTWVTVYQEIQMQGKHMSLAKEEISGPFELVFWGKGGASPIAPAVAGKCILKSQQPRHNRPKKPFRMVSRMF